MKHHVAPKFLERHPVRRVPPPASKMVKVDMREALEEALMDREQYILYMWLLFLRTPCKRTAPGEQVDLGEVGKVREKSWTKATPYSPAEPSWTEETF